MGLQALSKARGGLIQRQIRGCTNCNLHLYCRSPVPPSLPATPPELCIIGEAPGYQEDMLNEPFVGPAGQLLVKWLKSEMGLKRSQCVIGNGVQCRPTMKDSGKVNRTPSKTELDRCRDNVARTIEFYLKGGGEWILLLGGVALQTVTGFSRITRWAGRPFVLEHGDGLVKLMPTYHPAAALRDPSRKTSKTICDHLRYLVGLRKGIADWPEKCFCGKDVAVYDGMGVAWCEEHRMWRREGMTLMTVRPKQGRLV